VSQSAPSPGPGSGDPARRVVLVTGAATGVGLAAAVRLAREADCVVLTDRDAARLEEAVAAVEGAGGEARAVPFDVTDAAAVDAAVASVTADVGAPTTVVACAGIASSGKFEALTDAEWHRTFEVNVMGVVRVVRACLPAMRAAKRGRVVVIGSTTSLAGAAYVAHYTASKHAVLGLVRSLALEAARDGVTANCICPGYLDTEMTQRTIENIVRTTGRSAEDTRRHLEAQSPQRRLMRPEEVADAVAFLCSDAAAGINGQAIVLNGG